jgi:hypothetical protein
MLNPLPKPTAEYSFGNHLQPARSDIPDVSETSAGPSGPPSGSSVRLSRSPSDVKRRVLGRTSGIILSTEHVEARQTTIHNGQLLLFRHFGLVMSIACLRACMPPDPSARLPPLQSEPGAGANGRDSAAAFKSTWINARAQTWKPSLNNLMIF